MIRRKISSTLKLGLFCVIFGGLTLQGQGFVPSDNEIRLDEILRNVAEYCERLDHSVLDFICLENIEERFYKIPRNSKKTSPFKLNTYTYDFQMIKKGEEIKETRRLLKKNGLCFPSKFIIEEAYIRKYKKYVLSKLDVIYRDYKFFVVETQVNFKK